MEAELAWPPSPQPGELEATVERIHAQLTAEGRPPFPSWKTTSRSSDLRSGPFSSPRPKKAG